MSPEAKSETSPDPAEEAAVTDLIYGAMEPRALSRRLRAERKAERDALGVDAATLEFDYDGAPIDCLDGENDTDVDELPRSRVSTEYTIKEVRELY